MSGESLKTTPLHTLHGEQGARLVPYAGYAMPVQYRDGIKKEHCHTREQASLFDVSHMGQISITGDGSAEQFEKLVPSDIVSLANGNSRYTVLTSDPGGVIDDILVTRTADGLRLVVNAGCKDDDFEYLKRSLDTGLDISLAEDLALLAFQGPASAAVLNGILPGVDRLRFMTAGRFPLAGEDLLVGRSGYTGEDGFEISVTAGRAESLARQLLADGRAGLAGLGARDSLRLEAGLCLYGHELDRNITPVEAGLGWLVAKKYRTGDRTPGFPGATVILEQLHTGTERTRVGLQVMGRIPVREGATLINGDGNETGIVTSGGYGSTIGSPIAMGYVAPVDSVPGTVLGTVVRDRHIEILVVSLPFVQHRYVKS